MKALFKKSFCLHEYEYELINFWYCLSLNIPKLFKYPPCGGNGQYTVPSTVYSKSYPYVVFAYLYVSVG